MKSQAEAQMEEHSRWLDVFSAEATVDNTAAPGTLIQAGAGGYRLIVTDFIIYNSAAATAVITFYDGDSNIKVIFSVGNGETGVVSLTSGIRWSASEDIYARTDQATDAYITVSGRRVSTAFDPSG